jgi:hypothetical protein
MPQALAPREAKLLRRFGDRTNSLLALYPGFADFTPPGGGLVRFLDIPGARMAAGEPLAPAAERAEALERLAHAAPAGTRCGAMPVGRELAGELKARGFTVWQVGAEPIFDLADYFGAAVDLLQYFPLARTLKKRGGEVEEADFPALPQDQAQALRQELDRLATAWVEAKPGLGLGFLTRAEPLELAGEKRFFLLRVRGELQGFIAAAPFYQGGALAGCYLADILRAPWARAGAGDLLVLETLRLLHAAKVPQARLGMAPLARLEPGQPGARLLGALFSTWRWGYNFKPLYEYKHKLRPSRWEPLYLASTSSCLALALRDALRAHLPQGLGPALGRCALAGRDSRLALKPEALARLGREDTCALAPASGRDYLRRTRWTTLLAAFFITLHLARLNLPWFADLYAASAYVPGDVTWQGLFLGPLFHNHLFHLSGDQLSFYAFGALVELLLGPAWFWGLVAAGLWLSNPLTQALVQPLLHLLAPAQEALLLAERDYGSSNAVFALVGALCGALARPWWLLAPFLAYGAFICYARESWLALHHDLTLGLGLGAVLLWLRLRRPGAGK